MLDPTALEKRLRASLQHAKTLRAEHQSRVQVLERENVRLEDVLAKYRQESLRFEQQVAHLIGARYMADRQQLLQAVSERCASTDGALTLRIRGIVQGFGHNYHLFLMLVEQQMGEHNQSMQLMQAVLAQLLGPVVKASVLCRPNVGRDGRNGNGFRHA